jgi:guanylate kinase
MFQTLIESGEMQFWDYTLRNYYGYDRTLSRVSASEPVIIQALARMGLRIAREIPNSATIFLQMKNPTVGDARLGEREYGGEELLLRREHWAEEHAHATLFDIRVSEGEFADRAAIIELLVETAGSLT